MFPGKHLVAIAASIGLLMSAASSDASLILEDVLASLSAGALVVTDASPADSPGGITLGTEFSFNQGPSPIRFYEADFDNITDGEVRLSLRYLAVPMSGFDATWEFTFMPSFWGMDGKIETVVAANGNEAGASDPELFNDGQTLMITLDGSLSTEFDRTWDFTINAVSSMPASEPGTLFLIGVGLLGFARARRRS